MIKRLFIPILAAAGLAGCSELTSVTTWYGAEDIETEEQIALCDIGRQWPPGVIVRHHNVDGKFMFGELLNPQSFIDKGATTMRSVHAEPREPYYELKERSDCRDPNTGRYFPCIRKYQIDMTGVGAIARSNITDPAPVAMALCAQAARAAWKRQTGYPETNESQECRIIARAYCPLTDEPES